jgi:cobalt-zinc-cadmium efflux system protein
MPHDHDDYHDHDHDTHAGHDDHHGSGHGHDHAPKDFGKAFLIGVLLNAGFVAAEVVYGLKGNSVALLADAGHNLSDVLGLLLAWGAAALVDFRPTKRYTYGLRSTSILAALTNATLLLLVTGGIAWEAISRFRHPEQAEGHIVIVVAAIGVAINLATALLFMSGRKGDLNIRAAFTHMAGDAAIALGVVIAGVVIVYTGWLWLDPAVSLVIALLVIVGTWSLLRDSVNLALHAVPEGVELSKVRHYLESVDGVTEVHDLHVWGLSTTETALTAHLVMPAGYPGDVTRQKICAELLKHYSINHATLQIELGDSGVRCALAPDEVV